MLKDSQDQFELQIGDRRIGAGNPTLVIAEIGVNHDGLVRRAKELVTLAAACGADAVKLQIFSADQLMHQSCAFAEYQQDRVIDTNPVEMLRRYELGAEQVREVVNDVRRYGMLPLATPFSPGDVDVIAELELPAVKIASPDVVNHPLLQRVAGLGVPIIASTGAATLDEIATTSAWLRDWNCVFALLHCVSSYPAPIETTNLCWINELASKFNVLAGFSDHSTQPMAGALAVMAGASIVEKHLTYDRSARGPDHAASADPIQFEQYVKSIRLAEKMRGTPGKRVLEVEQDVRRVSRQSLVCIRDLEAGHELSEKDLTVQRPGTGISAAEVTNAIGRRLLRPITSGTLLQWDMLSHAA